MTETNKGLRFFFSAQDTFVGFPVAVGVFEPDVCEVLAMLLRPGMNCVDIGANFGFHSITMGAAVGSGGKVYSFEPDAFNFQLLSKNRSENRMEDIITLFNVACGDEDGEVELESDSNPSNFGGWHVVASTGVLRREHVRVRVRRVDGLIPQGTRIDVIKIDIEGYELLALRGLHALIETWRPVIICEFNTVGLERYATGTSTQLLAQFGNEGYVVHTAELYAKGDRLPFTYDGSSVCFANLVCVPRENNRVVG